MHLPGQNVETDIVQGEHARESAAQVLHRQNGNSLDFIHRHCRYFGDRTLADCYRFDSYQLAQLLNPWGDMANANCAMMSRAVRAPFIDEPASTNWKAVPAIGVTDLEDWASDGLGLGDQEFEFAAGVFHDRPERYGTMFNRHFNR